MAKKVTSVQINEVPKVDTMVAYNDKLVMYDNLNCKLSEVITPDVKVFLSAFPLRADFTVVFLCIKGRISIKCNLEEMQVTDCGLMVIVPGTIVEAIDFDMDSTLAVMAVPDQDYAPNKSYHNATYEPSNFTAPMAVQLNEEVMKSGIESYKQLKNALITFGDKITPDLIKAYIMVMGGLAAVSIQKWFIEHPEEKKTNKNKVLKEFLERVKRDYRDHRDVAYYAEEAGLNPKYFSQLIYKSSGKRPMDWIHEYVVLEAKSMLKSREYKISEVCKLLNFATQPQFNKYFKEVTGMTPSEYMKY